MEHRYSDRSTTDLNILIYKQNLLVALGVVKNIGKAGVFIESGFNELATNQPLEIEFFAEKAARNPRFKAVVVHRNEQGFGVEIENITAQLRQFDFSKSESKSRRRAAPTYPARAIADSGALQQGNDLGYASL